jgi:hypothetical protein
MVSLFFVQIPEQSLMRGGCILVANMGHIQVTHAAEKGAASEGYDTLLMQLKGNLTLTLIGCSSKATRPASGLNPSFWHSDISRDRLAM